MASVLDNFRLDGKTAIVTGSGAGIGRGIALMFARAGAAIAVVDLNRAAVEHTCALIAKEGGRALPFAVDVTNVAETKRVVEETVAKLGSIDVLVNNAGIYPPGSVLPEFSEDTFDKIFSVNVKATLRYMSEASRLMPSGSSIINMSSIESLRPDNIGLSFYCSSKAAINALTRSAALDLADKGIRVNAILPGVIATEGTSAMPEDFLKAFAQRTPSRRIGTTDDIAAAAVFLASSAASFVNGQSIVVDGGMTLAG